MAKKAKVPKPPKGYRIAKSGQLYGDCKIKYTGERWKDVSEYQRHWRVSPSKNPPWYAARKIKRKPAPSPPAALKDAVVRAAVRYCAFVYGANGDMATAAPWKLKQYVLRDKLEEAVRAYRKAGGQVVGI